MSISSTFKQNGGKPLALFAENLLHFSTSSVPKAATFVAMDFKSCIDRIALCGLLTALTIVPVIIPQAVKMSNGVLPTSNLHHVIQILFSS